MGKGGRVLTSYLLHSKDVRAEWQEKAYKRLGDLRGHNFTLDRRSLLKLYTTFVRSMLEYSDIIWDNCSLENKRILETIQLDAARILTGATKLCSTQKLYDDTCLEPLTSRQH